MAHIRDNLTLYTHKHAQYSPFFSRVAGVRLRLKCDGTHAETRFRLSAKRTIPFKSAWGRQFSRLLAAEVCASAVVMLDTPCSEVVWRVVATYCIHQFPLHFPYSASPRAITFQLDSTQMHAAFSAAVFAGHSRLHSTDRGFELHASGRWRLVFELRRIVRRSNVKKKIPWTLEYRQSKLLVLLAYFDYVNRSVSVWCRSVSVWCNNFHNRY